MRANAGGLFGVGGGVVTAAGAATWDQCGAGLTAVGRDAQPNGFWLRAANDLVERRHDGTVVAAREDTGDDGTVRTGTAGISAVHRAGLTTWDWATLLKRVWGFDAQACTGCGGRMRFIAVISHRAVIERTRAPRPLTHARPATTSL